MIGIALLGYIAYIANMMEVVMLLKYSNSGLDFRIELVNLICRSNRRRW